MSIYPKIRPRPFIPALLFACTLAMLAVGCKDEVVPAKGSQERSLTVIAREVDPVSGAVIGPARLAEIVIYEVTGEGDVELARLNTNDEGVAVFRRVFPAAGVNIKVIGTYKQERQQTNPPVILLCGDAEVTLRFAGVWPVCCPNDTTLVYRFIDETGNPDLIHMNPPGVSEYILVRTLFTVDCPNPGDELQVTIPADVPQPFRIREVRVDDRLVNGPVVTVRNGEALTVMFSVSTMQIGEYDESFIFLVQCPGSPAPSRVTVRLLADVVAFTCVCPRDTVISMEPGIESVEVGSVRSYPPRIIFSNPPNCRSIIVDSIISHDWYRSWTITQPVPGTQIGAGEDLRISTQLSPYQAGPAVDTFNIHFRLADGTPCRQRVELVGFGCHTMCPLVLRPTQQEFNSSRPIAVNFGTVAFSPNSACGGTKTLAQQEILLLLPDTACCSSPANVSITVEDPDPRRVNSRFLSITPTSSVQLYRRTQTNLVVQFTAPTVSEFEELFATGLRPRTGGPADSTFNLRIRLSNSSCGNCVQYIDVRVVIGTLIRVSNVITLYAYGQNTPKLPDPPVRKVCNIDCCLNIDGSYDIGRLFNMINPQTKMFPYPPDAHDFFVEVADTSYTRTPPQTPMLFRTPFTPFRNLIRFRTNYLERDFANVRTILDELQTALNTDPALFLQPSLPWTLPPGPSSVRPQPGDVYIIASDQQWTSGTSGHIIPCGIALLYIRKIFIGNEPNSFNDQSGIEYELIYPVVLY